MDTRTEIVRGGRAALLAALVGAAPLLAQEHAGHGSHAPREVDSADSAAVAATIGDFHDALARGDSTAAMEHLAPGARILEGGGIETREEYAGHHLPADMAFARAVPRDRGALDVTVHGDVAWVTSTSRTRGTYRDREIDSRGAELVVLRRGEDGAWRIEAVHWSSRSAG